ncbi:50S ribosomal protein L33 [Candidatus Legionella polyplacis]|uniref:Large ribosomal subunit protein bL33 n=1 Tax=Candidatus Legionella polyplacis TaxID=2005262 RepID=A0ABZ2GYS5_9GAMM
MSKSRTKIKLLSTSGSGYFTTTTKNNKNTPNKLKLMKYDPTIKKHCLFEEKKIK